MYWVIASGIVGAGSWASSEMVILGNGRLSVFDGALYSGFWLAFWLWSMWDVMIGGGSWRVSGWWRWVYFGAVNIIGVWLVSRWPGFTGLRIVGWEGIVLLGLVINLLQQGVWSWIWNQKMTSK